MNRRHPLIALVAVRENAECPSLSPDNTRIVFKKRVRASADKPWRLYVLDLESGTETPLAETQSIDDQALWLDNETVAYARSGVGDLDPSQVAGANPAGADIGPAAHWDIYSVPADGSGSPQLLVVQGPLVGERARGGQRQRAGDGAALGPQAG